MARRTPRQIAEDMDRDLKAAGITATFITDAGEVQIGAEPSEPEDEDKTPPSPGQP